MRLRSLLQFIESYCFDEQVYVVIPTSDGGEEEVFWRRGEVERPWLVQRRGGDGQAWRYSAAGLLPALLRRGASLEALERELLSVVHIHISFADQMLQEARRILGEDEVQAAVFTLDDLGRRLGEAIREVRAPHAVAAAPPAEDDRPPPRRGHLRLLARPLDPPPSEPRRP